MVTVKIVTGVGYKMANFGRLILHVLLFLQKNRKSCLETNTKAALRYRQSAILNLIQPPSQGHTSTASWPCYSALRISFLMPRPDWASKSGVP